MPHRRFVVDWSDPPYPEIVPADTDPDGDGQSFTECQAEIVEHFQLVRNHARAMIRQARAMRARDSQ